MPDIAKLLTVGLLTSLTMVGCWGCTSSANKVVAPVVESLNQYQMSAQSAVRIVLMHKSNGAVGTGTGGVFYRSNEVDDDGNYTYRMITAAHLVQLDMNQWHFLLSAIDVRDPFNAEIALCNALERVDVVNRELDYAIITFKSKDRIEPLKVVNDPEPIRLGEEVLMSGCDSGVLPITRSGRVALSRFFTNQPSRSNDYHEKHPEDFFALDFTASQGASGSCVLNNRGELVGIYILTLGTHHRIMQRSPIGMVPTNLFDSKSLSHINTAVRYSAIHRDLKAKRKLYLLGFEDDPEPLEETGESK
jgi:hypothetical protein